MFNTQDKPFRTRNLDCGKTKGRYKSSYTGTRSNNHKINLFITEELPREALLLPAQPISALFTDEISLLYADAFFPQLLCRNCQNKEAVFVQQYTHTAEIAALCLPEKQALLDFKC